jgi:secreted trypsin-like serine protease
MNIFMILSLAALALGKPNAKAGITLNNIPIGEGNGIKIIGGNDAAPGAYPWQVSLQNLSPSGVRYHMCGGTLVDPTHVVCASHCVVDQDASRLEIVAGGHNIQNASESTQQRVQVKELIAHANFSMTTIRNDVSIIVLATPIVFNERAQPLRLSVATSVEPTGKCINTGWGNSNPTGGQPVIIPDALQEVELDIVKHSTCQLDYFLIATITNGMVCAGRPERGYGACNGDSGGPLICFDNEGPYLAGIVSFGMQPCGQARFPSVYTRVGAYVDWIRERTNIAI